MSCGSNLCRNCKKVLNMLEAGTQTEDSFSALLSSPRPLRHLRSDQPLKIVKIEPCNGDLDESYDLFDDCNLSSISHSESFNCESFQKSISKEETLQFGPSVSTKDEFTDTAAYKNLVTSTARQTPDLNNSGTSDYLKCQTPSLNKKHTFRRKNTRSHYSTSYEQIIIGFNNKDSEQIRESFKNLVMIEKQSMHDSFFRRMKTRKY